MKPLISIRELSKLIGLSVPTLYGYVREKKVPFYKIGKRVLFRVEEIEEWVMLSARPITDFSNVNPATRCVHNKKPVLVEGAKND